MFLQQESVVGVTSISRLAITQERVGHWNAGSSVLARTRSTGRHDDPATPISGGHDGPDVAATSGPRHAAHWPDPISSVSGLAEALHGAASGVANGHRAATAVGNVALKSKPTFTKLGNIENHGVM